MLTQSDHVRQSGSALMGVSLCVVLCLAGCMDLPHKGGPPDPLPIDQGLRTSQKSLSEEFTPDAKLTPRELLERGREQNQKIDSYIARFRRQECEHGKLKPLGVLQFKYRREPLSVHFRWIGEFGYGREILWTKDQNDGKLQIRLAAGDLPLAKAGTKLSLSPDSPLVRAQSTHHISEAGFVTYLDILAERLQEQEKSSKSGMVKELGLARRPEYPYPLAGVEFVRFAGEEKCLTDDGKQQLFFDTNPNSPSFGLPVISLILDNTGQLMEYHCYDRVLTPVNLDDKDFDPAFLWRH